MKSARGKGQTLGVAEAAAELRVSESTVWRLLRAGELESVVHHGRRLVLRTAIERRSRIRSSSTMRALTPEHPLWKLVGAARSGGRGPGSSDKHEILSDG